MPTYAPCHVLLIDDDLTMSEMIQSLLAESKPAMDSSINLFHLEQVDYLAKGLAALEHQEDRIVLLDLNQSLLSETQPEQFDLQRLCGEAIAKVKTAHDGEPQITADYLGDRPDNLPVQNRGRKYPGAVVHQRNHLLSQTSSGTANDSKRPAESNHSRKRLGMRYPAGRSIPHF